jgi:cytosine/adenosine deaminase-related metal-dependent hydrolase
MRKLSANYVFPVSGKPIHNGIVVLSDNNEIVDVIDTGGLLYELGGVEFYNGILTPGFVNTHCHLELSYLKNKFTQHTGMAGFISQVFNLRNQPDKNDEAIIALADEEMKTNGIVAVGDISNASTSFNVKKSSKIQYYTFIEVFDIDESKADETYQLGLNLHKEAQKLGMESSIVPHTPHTVSDKLFRNILYNYSGSNAVYSIHNQESADENEFFITGKGSIRELFQSAGLKIQESKVTGKNSYQFAKQYFPEKNNILLIHNTFSGIDDIQDAKQSFNSVYWVLCPMSNLFIENTLPNINLMYQQGLKVTIGTDSYASNTSLSVLDEMKVIVQNFPSIPFNTLIQWATLNGAEALNMNTRLGSFEIGKKPGVNLITGFDFDTMNITSNSKVKALI